MWKAQLQQVKVIYSNILFKTMALQEIRISIFIPLCLVNLLQCKEYTYLQIFQPCHDTVMQYSNLLDKQCGINFHGLCKVSLCFLLCRSFIHVTHESGRRHTYTYLHLLIELAKHLVIIHFRHKPIKVQLALDGITLTFW